jgi:hypothetical protein
MILPALSKFGYLYIIFVVGFKMYTKNIPIKSPIKNGNNRNLLKNFIFSTEEELFIVGE